MPTSPFSSRSLTRSSMSSSPSSRVRAVEAEDQASRVPLTLTDENAHPESFGLDPETGMMLSLGTILTQEMQRFNGLLKVMRKTLHELQKAIKGLIVMTNELDAMFTAMQNNQQPAVWSKA